MCTKYIYLRQRNIYNLKWCALIYKYPSSNNNRLPPLLYVQSFFIGIFYNYTSVPIYKQLFRNSKLNLLNTTKLIKILKKMLNTAILSFVNIIFWKSVWSKMVLFLLSVIISLYSFNTKIK